MNGLSAEDILHAWDAGCNRHPGERALAILQLGMPEESHGSLSSLPVGRRDELLLRVRDLTIGTQIKGVTNCNACDEPVEFNVDSHDIRETSPATTDEHTLHVDETTVRFRAVDTTDLLTAAAAGSVDAATHCLLTRCIKHAETAGQVVDPDALPKELREAVGQQLADVDPNAEIYLSLNCPGCGHKWNVLLDTAAYFWDELANRAQRLVLEVHCLAQAYGWTESDVLALSPLRRQAYLELVL